ncbi:adventurous gliding motility lipoprotein CglC [Myxococcaceae bacterium GXIMD 01537]
MSMSPRHAILLSAAFLLGGCEVVTELGKPCVLVRKATQAELDAGSGAAVQIKEGDLTAGQDFISFGSVECEELICVRDAAIAKSGNDNAVAQGYCSRSCLDDNGSTCEVTDPDVDADVRSRMTCRQMLLDDEALSRLKASDPDAYRKMFGPYENSSFCAGRLESASANQP